MIPETKRFFKFLIFLLICSGVVSCEQPQANKTSKNVSQTNRQLEEPVPAQEEVQEIPLLMTYYLDSLQNAAQVDSFKTRFSELEQKFIFAINRMDAYRLNAGDKIVIPDTLTSDFLDYSPFPATFEMLDSIPKAVLISRRIQGFALYEHGKLLKWGPVSSGKESTQTPAGLFYGNYKARSKISTVNESWLMPYYFNFMNFEGVGVHQYSMPGYPASHACVRLREEDAISIYNWADQWQLDSRGQEVKRNGTPFMVFGDYDFDKPVPWLQLAEKPQSNYLTSVEMDTLKSYVTAYKKDERNFESPIVPGGKVSIPSEELQTLR